MKINAIDMKKQFLKFLGICAVTLMALSSCDFKDTVIMNLGSADLVVKNLSTGETIANIGIVLGGGPSLYVCRGDELELTYTPPKGAEDFPLVVDFSYFDKEKSVGKPPYTLKISTEDVEIGQYNVSCSVDYKSGSDSVMDSGSVSVEIGK